MRTKILVVMMICWSSRMVAQDRTDSLQALGHFLRICRSYQQAPMHAELTVQSLSNLPADGSDSSVLADFYVLKEGTYMRFGELEEIVNDSLALVISNDLHRMTLYTGAKDIIARTRMLSGMGIDASSLENMLSTCRISESPAVHGKGLIRVSSKNAVQGTSLGVDSIALEYDSRTQEPYRIVQIKRSLFPVDSSTLAGLQAKGGWEGKIVALPGSGNFVVHE